MYINIPNGRGREGGMPPTPQKIKIWLSSSYLTEIVGPQVWTGSYDFYINEGKIYKTCEAAEESAFLGSAQHTVGAMWKTFTNGIMITLVAVLTRPVKETSEWYL